VYTIFEQNIDALKEPLCFFNASNLKTLSTKMQKMGYTQKISLFYFDVIIVRIVHKD